MLKSILFLVTAFVAFGSHADEEVFTGFWKQNCDDAFGLQVMPAASGQYSVSFCGPGGCFEPGTYRPNTTLRNDPSYQVVDSTHIKVRGRDGWSDYVKCTTETKPLLQYKGCKEEKATTASTKGAKQAQCKS